MKKMLVLLAALALVLALSACGAEKAPAAPETLPAGESAPGEAPAAPEMPEAPSAQSEASAEYKEARPAEMLAAFRFALQQLCFEHVYPDGSDAGFESASGAIEDNHFAVYDVDGDGQEELIVSFTTSSMAGMMETVYGWDEAAGALTVELQEFPALTYYGGLAAADWSHNQGLAGESFWPYTLYRWDAASDSYVFAASVDAWDRSLADRDYAGAPYPADIDRDDAGIVYLINDGSDTKTLSKADYEAWYSEQFRALTALTVPYQALSEANIAALR